MLANELPPHAALDPIIRPPLIGRPKSSSGVVPPSQPGLIPVAALSTIAISANTVYYYPMWFETPTEIDALYFEVTVGAAGNARIGLTVADKDWQPLELLVDSGDIDVTGTGVKTAPFAPIVVHGLVLVEMHSAVGITVRCTVTTMPGGMAGAAAGTLGSSPCYRLSTVALAYGALRNPGPRWNTMLAIGSGISSFGFVRVSDPDPQGW